MSECVSVELAVVYVMKVAVRYQTELREGVAMDVETVSLKAELFMPRALACRIIGKSWQINMYSKPAHANTAESNTRAQFFTFFSEPSHSATRWECD